MKSAVKIGCAALVLAVLLTLAVIGSGIGYSWLGNAKPEVSELAVLTPADKVALGSDVRVEFSAEIPEDRSIRGVKIGCGKGSVAVGTVQWKRTSWKWSKSIWHFSAVIRPLESGSIGEGKITVELSGVGSSAGKAELQVVIPEFTAQVPPTEKAGADLPLAPEMEIAPSGSARFLAHILRYKYMYTAAMVILAVIAFLIYRIYKRKSRGSLEMCWDVAIAALEVLQEEISSGDVLPRTGFTRLNDILRNYLEARFALPASRCTTPEFLTRMAAAESPLPEQCRGQLADFLTTADMVRFAREEADVKKLEHFLIKVTRIIRDTIPQLPDAERSAK